MAWTPPKQNNFLYKSQHVLYGSKLTTDNTLGLKQEEWGKLK